MRSKWMIALPAMLLALLAFFALPALAENEGNEAEWTVMFYMCGSDLESRYGYATENLKDIAGCHPYFNFEDHELLPGDLDLVDASDKCGLDGVNVVVETGGCKQWHTEELNMPVDTSALQRWHFSNDAAELLGDFVLDETLPLQSMADPKTLSDFIRWSAANYPAKKYALVLWDHGGGSMKGLFIDELFENDTMRLDELGAALRESGMTLECVLLDACMMANVETACAIGDSARWMIASEEVVAGKGSAVADWLQQLCYIPEMDGEALGRLICDTTQIKYSKQDDKASQDILTWSVIDLSQADRLAELFDRVFAEIDRVYVEAPLTLINLAKGIIRGESYGTGQENQWDLAGIFFSENETRWDPRLRRDALAALRDAVVYSVRGSGRSAARGLSFCYAVDFDIEELNIYAHNCPSPHFLALLDAISPWTAPDWVYERAERLPDLDTLEIYRTKVKRFAKPDGTPVFDFVSNEVQEWSESNVIRYNLYREEKTGTIVRLGLMPADFDYWEEDDDYIFAYSAVEPWLWPAVEGVTCAFDVLTANRPGWSEFLGNIPIMIDGEYGDLRCGYNEYENQYTVYGLWDGYDSNTGMFNRNVRSLAQLAGQTFAPVYPIFDGEYDSGDDWFKGQTLKMYRTLEVTNEPLPAGTYYIEYVIYDMFMRPMFLDWARMDWDGQTATFPDADSWQGEVELKVADSYW